MRVLRSLDEAGPQRQALDAPVDRRLQTLDRAGQLELLEAGEQEPVDRLQLHPGQLRAEAEMLAETERQMRVRVAVDAEGERVLEHVLVAVGRGEVERDLVAGRDRHAADLAVLRGDACEV